MFLFEEGGEKEREIHLCVCAYLHLHADVGTPGVIGVAALMGPAAPNFQTGGPTAAIGSRLRPCKFRGWVSFGMFWHIAVGEIWLHDRWDIP